MFPVPLPFPYRTPVPRSWERWTRKVRVGANSPSLWPTIDSLMYTGTCLRPSCTAMVWPTMSGMIVERRDQVLITRLSRLRFRSSIFFSRWSSTNGPFLSDRPIVTYLPVLWPWFPGPLGGRGAHPEPPRAPWGPRNGPGAREPLPPPPLAAAAQDHLVGGLVAAAGATLRLAPRAHRVAATGALALATAERVIDRVHGDAARLRAPALVAAAPGLAPGDQVVPGIADLADRGPAGHLDLADLTRGHPQGGAAALLGQQLDGDSGRTAHLGAAARAQLHGVHQGSDRDAAQRQGVARLDVRALAGLHHVAHTQAVGRQDVALLAVEVVEQRDAGGPVRVVLDRRHLGRHSVLVAAEVDDAVALLVATAAVPRGDAAVHVAPAGLRGGPQQRLLRRRLRHLDEVGAGGAAPPWRGWLVIADTHQLPSKSSILSSGCRVTSARLVDLRTPMTCLVRLRLPLRCKVFTFMTRTEKMACTASLISVLFAPGLTMNV